MSNHPPARGQWDPIEPNIQGDVGDPHLQWHAPTGTTGLEDKEPLLILSGVGLALIAISAYFFNF